MPKSKSVKNPTFKSYIDENGINEASSNSKFYGSEIDRGNMSLHPDTLPGELLVTRIQHVVRYSLFYDKAQGGGVIGDFILTNFRIIFLCSDDVSDKEYQRNKLIREDDIVLNCVESLYQVSKGKKKKVVLDGSTSGTVKTLAIHCKDFQIHTFSFKMTPKDERKKTVRALIHYCFPVRLNLLFAFDYRPREYPGSSDVPRYVHKIDWEREVDRLAVTGFKVLQCNTDFQNCDSLPEVMVVPDSMDLPELKKYANQFVDYRWPVWSYTYQSKASLVRMACVIADPHEAELEKRIYEKIRLTRPEHTPPHMLDFLDLQQSQMLPSLKEVSQSFEKLRELCMPSKKKVLFEDEKSWYSSLESCGWLLVVSKILRTAVQVADHIVKKNNTVILKENNSRELTPVLTCLVQLLLDPHYRTLTGFQSVVEREWVALGHDFTNSCGLLQNSNQSPVFILFLDCVWQLQVQFPSAFQFSEVYLTTIWDTVSMGFFDNFIFDSVRRRQNAANGFQQYTSKDSAVQLLSAWDWSQQFDKENLALFQNPLYITRTELNLNIPTSNYKDTSSSRENKLMRVYSRKLSKMHEHVPNQDIAVLRPEASVPMLKVWSQCYLRWITPLQIQGGGNPSGYLQQCVLVEEIFSLQRQIQNLQSNQQIVRSARPRSDLVFGFEDSNLRNPREKVMRWTQRMALTSSFPFRSTSGRSTSSDTPISLFLNGSFIQDSDDDLDTESVDALSILEPEETMGQ